jgi:uncharacterized membrane protein
MMTTISQWASQQLSDVNECKLFFTMYSIDLKSVCKITVVMMIGFYDQTN